MCTLYIYIHIEDLFRHRLSGAEEAAKSPEHAYAGVLRQGLALKDRGEERAANHCTG